MKLPREINAIRTVTYRVDKDLIESVAETNEIETDEVTLEHLMDLVSDWAVEDLASIHNGIIFRDERNNEIGNL